MTDDDLWSPGADPNAETKATWTRPWVSVPQQRADRLDATRVMREDAISGAYPGPGGPGAYPGVGGLAGPGGPQGPGRAVARRRMLFAAGGLMLLAGGGVAAAAAMGSRSGGTPRATGGTVPVGSTGTGTVTPSRPASSSAAASTSGTSESPSPPETTTTSSSGNGVVATQPQWYVDDQGPMAIALTMDDGPSALYTPQVLEVLRDHGVKATFNMVGQLVGANLSLVREVSAEGHTITNHTWNHADLTHYTYSAVCSQIDRCNEALANANQTPTIFRAPYGNWSKAVFEACAARNLRPVGWSVDPRDWDTAHVDTYDIVQNVMRHTHAHDIILEHDGGGDRRNTVAALKLFIPQLIDKGFTFVAM